MSTFHLMVADSTVSPPSFERVARTSGFSLLKLPREIRDRIYLYTLIKDHTFAWPSYQNAAHLSPAILETCRQVYEEAAPLLYRANSFAFAHPSDCTVFRWIMDQRYAREMSKVTFRIAEREMRLWATYFDSTDHVRSLTYDLPNLKLLFLHLKQNWWNSNIGPEQNLKIWSLNRHLKQLCHLLQQRTNASVVVVCSVSIPLAHFEHIKLLYPEMVESRTTGKLMTQTTEMYTAKVMLELVARVPKPHTIGVSA